MATSITTWVRAAALTALIGSAVACSSSSSSSGASTAAAAPAGSTAPGAAPTSADASGAGPSSSVVVDPSSSVAAGSSAPAGALGCTSDALSRMCLRFDFTGAATVHAEGVPGGTPSALACGAWAAGGRELAGPTVATLPFPDGPVNGAAVSVLGAIQDYTGPGTYPLTQVVGLGDKFQVSVGDAAYESNASSTGSVTVEASGAGSVTFTGLVPIVVGGEPVLSGTMTWTCADPA